MAYLTQSKHLQCFHPCLLNCRWMWLQIGLNESTSPEILREVENILEHKLSTVVTQDYTQAGGVETLVAVLNRVDRATENNY